jgi:hypothetical protein
MDVSCITYIRIYWFSLHANDISYRMDKDAVEFCVQVSYHRITIGSISFKSPFLFPDYLRVSLHILKKQMVE